MEHQRVFSIPKPLSTMFRAQAFLVCTGSLYGVMRHGRTQTSIFTISKDAFFLQVDTAARLFFSTLASCTDPGYPTKIWKNFTCWSVMKPLTPVTPVGQWKTSDTTLYDAVWASQYRKCLIIGFWFSSAPSSIFSSHFICFSSAFSPSWSSLTFLSPSWYLYREASLLNTQSQQLTNTMVYF